MVDSALVWLKQRLFHVEPRVNVLVFWCRVAVWVCLSLWGWYFIQTRYDEVIGGLPEINYSFMHRVDLVFHEAGHVIFIPLGRFMSVLGGSLGQLMIPGLVLGMFLFKYRNAFGASVGLWWLAQSLMDIAPYIADARAQQIILLGGGTGRDRPGMHDWNNILNDLGMLEHDHAIAATAEVSAEALMLLAIAWGAFLLYRQSENLRRR